MNESPNLRMLLSHNFEMANDYNVPALSRDEFTKIFVDGFSIHPEVQCRQLTTSAHWIVEILCPTTFLTPQQVGEKCVQMLFDSRKKTLRNGIVDFDLLIVSGLKTTPTTSKSPDALQLNQWGADVVETKSGAIFLQLIDWEGTVAGKPAGNTFKAEVIR